MSHWVLSPMEVLEKLAALVPPPRLNLIRYQGVLTPTHPLSAPAWLDRRSALRSDGQLRPMSTLRRS